jgi:hypothetical protein
MFEKIPKSEVSQLGLVEISFIGFLGIEIFYQVFLIMIFIFGFCVMAGDKFYFLREQNS